MDIQYAAKSPESVAERIRRLRRQRGLTLRTLATAVGVSAPAVARWEKGSATPRYVFHAPLADALAVSETELFGQGWDEPGNAFQQSSAERPRRDVAAQPRALSLPAPLPEVISAAKEMIAAASGTTRDKVTIKIEM